MRASFSQGLTDTSPDAEAFQLGLLREATPERRVAMALSLSATVITLARRGLARMMPDATPDDVALRFVELQYGSDVAMGLKEYLRSRRA